MIVLKIICFLLFALFMAGTGSFASFMQEKNLKELEEEDLL